LIRTSNDNGVTWTPPRAIDNRLIARHQVISGTLMTKDGVLMQNCDAAPGGNGGTALHISRDGGRTWTDPGEGKPKPSFTEGGKGEGTIAGIHAKVAELGDGRLLAFGRGDAIDGRMPMSISADLGGTWTYKASPFPPIGGGQRLVLKRLREGPLLFVSFTSGKRSRPEANGMTFTDQKGNTFTGHGMYAAVSFDDGKTWPVRKLLTPGEGEFDGGAWTRRFTATPTRAEHAGYLAATQTPDGVIHLISSRLHYRFNLPWLLEGAPRGDAGPTESAATRAQKPGDRGEADLSAVPGVVIDHVPQATGMYVGSPSIAVLPDGDYVASHDLFGPRSSCKSEAITRVFRSSDRGKTWRRLPDIRGAFWSNLFVRRGALYLLGTRAQYRDVLIRRSTDGGETWTTPSGADTGLLAEGRFHCAPVPVIVHGGRLWRAMEDANGGGGWARHFRSYMMSAPVGSDLLRRDSWTFSNPVKREASWLNGQFGGWLEGNAVAGPDGKVYNLLRVDCARGGKAASIRVSDDGKTQRFDPATGFVDFPGGAKKFTIRFDPASKHYWSLSNAVFPRHQGPRAAGSRNTLVLLRSGDLRTWETRCILLYHLDRAKHGFQYPDWRFDGEDIIVASRTAFDDGLGGAHSAHDANLLTFHRVKGFRRISLADSAIPPDELQGPPKIRTATDDYSVEGTRIAVATLREGGRAYGNRDYVWKAVPERFAGWRYTRTQGGVRASVKVTASRDTTVYAATATTQSGADMTGWEPLAGVSFYYSDRGRTRMHVFKRSLRAGRSLEVAQRNWSGTILLLPRTE
jgi:hypothetical protein